MSFHDTRLPEFISIFAVGMPCFSTSIVKTNSGREIRSADHFQHNNKYIIRNCKLSHEQFAIFNGFFRSRLGQKFSFLFKDSADYCIEKQIIGVGDNNQTRFQLFKNYSDEVIPFKKIITHPNIKTLKIWLGENEIQEGFKVDGSFIIFTDKVTNNIPVIVSLEFDLEVRFNQDNFEYSLSSEGAIALSDIEIIEVGEAKS